MSFTLSNLEDIRILREFQNNDSIPLRKFFCSSGTLLTTGYDEEENVILYCTCCQLVMTPGAETISILKEEVEKYGASQKLH